MKRIYLVLLVIFVFGGVVVWYLLRSQGMVNEVPAANSKTARTLDYRFGEVLNVRDYGATGDGTTDDGPAIQLAVDALPSGGGVVSFPDANSYMVNTRVTITTDNTTIDFGTATILNTTELPTETIDNRTR